MLTVEILTLIAVWCGSPASASQVATCRKDFISCFEERSKTDLKNEAVSFCAKKVGPGGQTLK